MQRIAVATHPAYTQRGQEFARLMEGSNMSQKTTHPAWVHTVDEETGWGPNAPIVLDSGEEVDVDLMHHPETRISIHLAGIHSDDPLTVADARRLASALLDLADIADPGKLATQALRDLIEDGRYGQADAGDLHQALTTIETDAGLPVTEANG